MAKLDCTGPCDVVEFGCGYGHFTLAAARAATGTVYALDIEPAMIAATRKRAAENGISNIVTVERDFLVDGCGRPAGSADYAMLFNILHIEEPEKLLGEAYRVLAPGARLGIIHWKRDPQTPRGPNLDIRPTSEQSRTWAESAGFRFVRDEELCCCAWHWGLVMDKPVIGPSNRLGVADPGIVGIPPAAAGPATHFQRAC